MEVEVEVEEEVEGMVEEVEVRCRRWWRRRRRAHHCCVCPWKYNLLDASKYMSLSAL